MSKKLGVLRIALQERQEGGSLFVFSGVERGLRLSGGWWLKWIFGWVGVSGLRGCVGGAVHKSLSPVLGGAHT